MLSQSVIEQAVADFRTTLEKMAAANDRLHAFDVGMNEEGQMESVIVMLMPRELADKLLSQFMGVMKAFDDMSGAVGISNPFSIPVIGKESKV